MSDFQPGEAVFIDNARRVQFVRYLGQRNETAIVKLGPDTHVVASANLSREEG